MQARQVSKEMVRQARKAATIEKIALMDGLYAARYGVACTGI
jgi:hypothetical protein